MSSAFEKATEIQRLAADDERPTTTGRATFRATIPDGWQQGKGAFGGVVVGILTRAMVASEPDRTRRLRSLTADLCAPALVGSADVEVVTLRRGGTTTFVEARVVQNGSVIARSSAALACARALPELTMRPAPPVQPPWSDVAVVPVEPPFGPVFARHYEYRSTGPVPLAGGTEAGAAGWVREKQRPTTIDEAAIVALLDSWWPTSLAIESKPRAVSTVGYTMQLLLAPRSLPVTEPLFYRAQGVAAADNFFVEMRELWFEDRVVAYNQQTFAVLG